MSTVAHQLSRFSRIVTVGAAILFAIFYLAVTGGMGAFIAISHFLSSLLQSMHLLLTRRQRLCRKTFQEPQ
jgi:hypothetical protein